MPKITERYSLNFKSIGPVYGPHEEIRSPKNVKSWESAIQLLNSKYFIVNGNKITINIDWSKAVEDSRKDQEFIEKIDVKPKTKKEAKRVLDLVQPKPYTIPCKVHIDTRKKKKLEQEFSRFYVWYYLHEVFLLLNLSSPGCANFYSLQVPSKGDYNKTNLNLSADFFELAWIRSIDEKDFDVGYVPLEKVLKWYNHFQVHFKQIASCRTERALFAILHVCSNDAGVNSVIWIAHALEALYDTKIGRSFNDLFERSVKLLEIPLEKRKSFKKELREFYDLRSAFVHGGLDISHPISEEFRDFEDKLYERALYACEFGAALVISTMQALITHGWSEITYKEELVGHIITDPASPSVI